MARRTSDDNNNSFDFDPGKSLKGISLKAGIGWFIFFSVALSPAQQLIAGFVWGTYDQGSPFGVAGFALRNALDSGVKSSTPIGTSFAGSDGDATRLKDANGKTIERKIRSSSYQLTPSTVNNGSSR